MAEQGTPFNSRPLKFAAAASMLIAVSGCDRGATERPSPGAAFATAPIESSNSYGGMFSAGVLVVSHATGAVDVCWQKCAEIGKIAPSGAQDLVLTSAQGLTVYIANVATGVVVFCTVASDDFVSKFKGGRCETVGTVK